MNLLQRIESLSEEVLKLSRDQLIASYESTQKIPDEFRLWWKSIEFFLSTSTSNDSLTAEYLEKVLALIGKVLNHMPTEVYGTKIPVIQKLIWFCDDYLAQGNSLNESLVSQFHLQLIDLRRNNPNSFRTRKWNFTDHQENQIGKLFDEVFSTDLEDDHLLQQLIICGEQALPDLLDKHLEACNDEKDYAKLSELIWSLFEYYYFMQDGLKVALPAWIKTARRIIFQSTVPELLFHIVAFLPVILEQAHSLPFRKSLVEQFKELFDETMRLIRQIHFPAEFSHKLDPIIRQYWKFFFYFLRHEKFLAFQSCLQIFVVLMEKDFVMSKGRSSYSAELSEIFYALDSNKRRRYQNYLQEVLLSSIEDGSSCFLDLFPSQTSVQTLSKQELLDAIVHEALKDGKLDKSEREILIQLFSVLNLDKHEIRSRIQAVQRQISGEKVQIGALNPRDTMTKLLRIAFHDGLIDESEKQLLFLSGQILGIAKIEIQQLLFIVKNEPVQDVRKPLRISSFFLKPDFEFHWEFFQNENIHLEEISRNLKTLLENDSLTLDGDIVDWGDLEGASVNVEISLMPDTSKMGIFFFVEPEGVFILREILQTLSFVIVDEGAQSSRIILKLCDGHEVVIDQSEGLEINAEIQETLNMNKGYISLVLVDAKNRQVVSHFENGCSIIAGQRWRQGQTAIADSNHTAIKLLTKKANREMPGDRYARHIICRYLLDRGLGIDGLNEFENYYKYVSQYDSRDFEFLYMFGVCLVEAGRHQDAAKILKMSIAAHHRYMPSLLALCKLFQKEKSAEFYVYFKKLQVYFWNHPEVKAYRETFEDKDFRSHCRILGKTPFLLN